jgi:hypothetical protein
MASQMHWTESVKSHLNFQRAPFLVDGLRLTEVNLNRLR